MVLYYILVWSCHFRFWGDFFPSFHHHSVLHFIWVTFCGLHQQLSCRWWRCEYRSRLGLRVSNSKFVWRERWIEALKMTLRRRWDAESTTSGKVRNKKTCNNNNNIKWNKQFLTLLKYCTQNNICSTKIKYLIKKQYKCCNICFVF